MLILDKVLYKDLFVHKASNTLCGCIEEPSDGSVALLTESNQEIIVKADKLQSDFVFFSPKTRQVEEFMVLG